MKVSIKTISYSQFILLILVFYPATQLQAQTTRHERRAIQFAKNIQMSRLASKLSNKRFADWLQILAGRQAEISWEVNECGEQPGEVSIKLPLCVQSSVTKGNGLKITIVFDVGTYRSKRFTGKPRFISIGVEMDGNWTELNDFRSLLKKLRDLEKIQPGNSPPTLSQPAEK